MNSPSPLFDSAYVINLDSRPDRWEKMQASLNQVGIQAQRFSAVSVDRLQTAPPKELEQFLLKADGPRADAEKKLLTTWACLHSHLEVIRQAKRQGATAVLILEDDCEFEPYARAVLRKAAAQLHESGTAWDMLYLGGTFKKGGHKQRLSSNLYQMSRVRLAHAYIVSASVYDKILNEAPSSGLPLDWYYSEQLSSHVQTLMLEPKIAYQREYDLSDIESVQRIPKFKLRRKIKHWTACVRYGVWPF